MALSYNRMWKLLVDKKMSKADLRKAARYCAEYNDKATAR